MIPAYTWLTASVTLDTVLSTASCCPRDSHFSLAVFQSSCQWYAVYIKLDSLIVNSIEESHNHYILELQNFLFSNYRPHSEECGKVMFLHPSFCRQGGILSWSYPGVLPFLFRLGGGGSTPKGVHNGHVLGVHSSPIWGIPRPLNLG